MFALLVIHNLLWAHPVPNNTDRDVEFLLSFQDNHLRRRSTGELVVHLQLLCTLLVTVWCCIHSMVRNRVNTDTKCCIQSTFTSTDSSHTAGERIFPPGCDGEKEIRKTPSYFFSSAQKEQSDTKDKEAISVCLLLRREQHCVGAVHKHCSGK